MIVNIQKGGYIRGIIEYHEKKVRAGKAELLYDNTQSQTVPGRVEAYMETAELNPGVKRNKFLHIAVSFNINDRDVQGQDMVKIGEKYLEEMGIRDTPVLMYEHVDRKHRHFHIVTTTIDFAGKKVNDFNDHYRSQLLTRRLEKELGLTPTEYVAKEEQKLQEINATKYKILNSLRHLEGNQRAMTEMEPYLTPEVITHARLNQLDDREITKLLLERGNDQEGIGQIYRILNKHNLIERSYKQQLTDQLNQLKLLSRTREEFLQNVEAAGIYIRKIAQRNDTHSLTYGMPGHGFYVKEKDLPVAYRYDYLYTGKKLELSFDQQQQKTYLRRIVSKALNRSNSIQEFEKQLLAENIEVKYASNARGIYGISFHSGNLKGSDFFTGSEIDRKVLSWNNISKRLNAQGAKIEVQKKAAEPDIFTKPGPQITRVVPKLFENPDDEDAKKKKRGNDQNKDLEKD